MHSPLPLLMGRDKKANRVPIQSAAAPQPMRKGDSVPLNTPKT